MISKQALNIIKERKAICQNFFLEVEIYSSAFRIRVTTTVTKQRGTRQSNLRLCLSISVIAVTERYIQCNWINATLSRDDYFFPDSIF